MDAGEHPDGGADRLLAIEDLTQGLRREEGQAEQPGHLRLVDALALSDPGEGLYLAKLDPLPPKMRLGDGLDEGRGHCHINSVAENLGT